MVVGRRAEVNGWASGLAKAALASAYGDTFFKRVELAGLEWRPEASLGWPRGCPNLERGWLLVKYGQ